MSDTELLSKFGARIKTLRNARGLSQQELSESSNLHRTYISMVERGEKNVTLVSIAKLALGLRMTIEELTCSL